MFNKYNKGVQDERGRTLELIRSLVMSEIFKGSDQVAVVRFAEELIAMIEEDN